MGKWFQNLSVKVLKETAKYEPVDPQSDFVDMESVFPGVNESIDVAAIPKMQVVKKAGKVLYAQPFLWEKKINFHPSQIAKLCPHEYFFMAYYFGIVNSEDAGSLKKAKHALKMLKAYEQAERSSFKPETHPKMGQGTAMHAMLQFYGGLTHDLVGQWRCPQCGHCTPEDKMVKMPTQIHKDKFGKSSRVAKPCPECGDNINTHDWAWVYIEPTFHIPEYKIHGSTDGIRMVNDLKGIVEFKTINDNGFKGDYMKLPKEEHVFQSTCYAYAMGADFINLIYINKNTMAEKEFIFLPDYKKVLAPAFAKIKTAMQAVKKGTQPEGAWRACDSIKTPRAQKCPFAEECFGKNARSTCWDREHTDMSNHEMLKTDGTPTAKARRDMLKRLKPLGFLQFEAYLLKRSGKSIKGMAAELEISEEEFRVYHDACLQEKGIGPLEP